ncbi:MAG TPA: thiamine diphosphokinase [Patescibacteria group bacterium]|nr:thiamine diphosphokinase [Patescibacteria group bacterium]
MKSVAIVAGGEKPKRIPKADFFIGVDRGALWLLRQGIVPDIAVGDFDSVTNPEKKFIHDRTKKYIEFPQEKDETDLELAIDEAIRLKPNEVCIYGALGKRFDHGLTAIGMLLKLESHNIYGEIVDNFNKINIVRHQFTLTKDKKYPYVSIIPLDASAIVSLKGFMYNVSKKIFSQYSSLGISNEIPGKSATIFVHQGKALVILSRD